MTAARAAMIAHTQPPAAASSPTVLVGEGEFVRRRVARALKLRKRYRYVEPEVRCEAGHWRVTSPNCSRTVDPKGGVIDIARIEHRDAVWVLQRYSHSEQSWLVFGVYPVLDELLQILCADSERVFWP